MMPGLNAAKIAIATIIAGAATLPAQAGAAPLNFCMEDIPQAPWTLPEGSGLNIELLKRVAKLTGDQFNYVARPWKRCEAETRSGIMDGMIGPSDNPRRRAFSRPPLKADGTQDPAARTCTTRARWWWPSAATTLWRCCRRAARP